MYLNLRSLDRAHR